MSALAQPEPEAPHRLRLASEILDGEAPPRAMLWFGDGLRRYSVLATWRNAVLDGAGSGGRAIRVAWVLAGLFNSKSGFCHAGDKTIAKMARVHVSHLPATLRGLEDAGLIVRATVMRGSKRERRIWPRLP
jgi:hypothetical protein